MALCIDMFVYIYICYFLQDSVINAIELRRLMVAFGPRGYLEPEFRELVTELGKSGAKSLQSLKERGLLGANEA